MRELARIGRIMYKIGKLWVLRPQERFFQLLFNHTQLGTRTRHLGTIKDPFHIEDKDLEKQLDKVLNIFEKEAKKKKKRR